MDTTEHNYNAQSLAVRMLYYLSSLAAPSLTEIKRTLEIFLLDVFYHNPSPVFPLN